MEKGCGSTEGTVKTIATDMSSRNAVGQEECHPLITAFKAIVTLNSQQLTARGQSLLLSSGCKLSQIRQGERTAMEYLL